MSTCKRKNQVADSISIRHALNGKPFQLHFFYGAPDSQTKPSDYYKASNLIGTYRTFTSPMVSADTSNAMRHRRLDGANLSTGQISLSPLLANALATGILPDSQLAAEHVVPALSDNLEWRLTDFEQNEVPVQNLADNGQLRVAVVSRDVEPILPGQEYLFPRYGEWVEWEDVTNGKAGGA